MNKTLIFKFIAIMLLVILTLTNISLAINLTNDKLKGSMEKIYSSKIEVEVESKTQIIPGDGVTIEGDDTVTSTSSLTYDKPGEVIVDDSKVIIKEVDEESGQKMELTFDYLLADNILTIKSESTFADFGIQNNGEYSEPELAFASMMFLLMQNQILSTGYIAACDAIGQDINLAYSYYSQISNAATLNGSQTEGAVNLESNVFKTNIKMEGAGFDTKFLSNIEINLDNLAALKESDLDGTAKATVTIISSGNVQNNNTVNNTVNNIVNNSVNNVANNTVNNAVNNVANNVVNNTNKVANNIVNNSTIKVVDGTTTNKVIPETGLSTFVQYAIIAMVIISLTFYFRIRMIDKKM